MVKNLPANAGDVKDAGSIPGLGRSPGRGNGTPLQYFCLEKPMDRGAWWATVHGVAKSRIWLSIWAHSTGFWYRLMLGNKGQKRSQKNWNSEFSSFQVPMLRRPGDISSLLWLCLGILGCGVQGKIREQMSNHRSGYQSNRTQAPESSMAKLCHAYGWSDCSWQETSWGQGTPQQKFSVAGGWQELVTIRAGPKEANWVHQRHHYIDSYKAAVLNVSLLGYTRWMIFTWTI